MTNKLRRAYRRVMRFIEYAPLIWRDEDWDYHFIIDMLCYKIQRTHDCIRDNKLTAEPNYSRTLKSMRVTLKLLDRVKDDRYADLLNMPDDVEADVHGFLKAYRGGIRMRERDLSRAMRVMDKHLFRWWD